MTNIRLNFLSLVNSDFSFDVYRRIKKEGEIKDDTVYQARLPITRESKEKATYLISTEEKEGYDIFTTNSSDSINLTKRIILKALYEAFAGELIPYPISYQKKFGGDIIEFTVEQHTKGRKIIFISS